MENASTEVLLQNIQNIEREIKEFKSDYKTRNQEVDNKFDKIDNKFDKIENKIDKLTERMHRNEMKVYGISVIIALAVSGAARYFIN